MPWPPPTHMVSSPNCLSWNCRELMSVVVMRAPVMPKGWPTAIAPPLTLSLSGVDPELACRRDHLGREGLVDLDEVDVVDGEPGAGERLREASTGPRPMISGDSAAHAGRDDPGERGQAELAGPGVGHDDDRRGAVVERTAVAGGDGAVGAEDRCSAGHAPRA